MEERRFSAALADDAQNAALKGPLFHFDDRFYDALVSVELVEAAFLLRSQLSATCALSMHLTLK